MSTLHTADEKFPDALLRSTVNFILTTQNEDGSIPWFTNGKTDPWNHTEAAMGLSIGGEHRAEPAEVAAPVSDREVSFPLFSFPQMRFEELRQYHVAPAHVVLVVTVPKR